MFSLRNDTLCTYVPLHILGTGIRKKGRVHIQIESKNFSQFFGIHCHESEYLISSLKYIKL